MGKLWRLKVTKQQAEKVENDHLTVSEAQKALAALSKADMIRLRRLEKWFTRNDPASSLLTDAILKTWEGVRSWKRGMGAYEHLYGVMRSLANNEYKKQTVGKKSEAFMDDEGEDKPAIALQTSSPSPETLLIEQENKEERERHAQALAKQVLDLFSDDEDATWILMGEMDGQPAEETRKQSGMDQKRYDTTRRRIRRKLDKHFPDKKKT